MVFAGAVAGVELELVPGGETARRGLDTEPAGLDQRHPDRLRDGIEFVGNDELPFPSPADVFYLGAIPVMAMAMFMMGRDRGRSIYRFRALDVAVICTGAGAAIWTLSGNGNGAMASHGLERFILVAYPTGDVVLVGMCAFALTSASRSPALLSMTAGVACLVVADVGFVHLVQIGAYVSGHPIALFWPLGFMLMGLGALLPDRSRASQRSTTDRRSRALPAMLFLSSTLIPASAAWSWSRGLEVDGTMLAVASSLMTTLVLIRLTLVSNELERAGDVIRGAHDRVDRSNELRGILLERGERAAEDGRRSLAADLHDGPIQNLAALQYGIEAALMEPKPDAHEIADLAVDGVRQEIQNLRDIMSWLRPPALDERGLEFAISDLGTSLSESSGVNVDVRCDLQTELAPDLEAIVYRLVQESLRNVARHAGASNVQVRVGSDVEAVCFSVVDDGRGFNPDDLAAAPRRGHFGIASMRERVDLAGGTWAIQAGAGSGVALQARLPHQHVTCEEAA